MRYDRAADCVKVRFGMTKYDKQAQEFVEATGLIVTKRYQGHHRYFNGDKEQRAVWEIEFDRRDRRGHPAGKYTFTFGNSLAASYQLMDFNVATFVGRKVKPGDGRWTVQGIKEAYRNGGGEFQHMKLIPKHPTPTDYDILACLATNPPGSFSEFCGEFGYSEDSISARDTWMAVAEQASKLTQLFSAQELEQLAEIQ